MIKVLVIDDDTILREVLVLMLQSEGITVDSAENGKIGLELLQQATFDLVITDIIMPDMEGIETIVKIKKLKPTLPIIAVSGGGKMSPDVYLEMAQNFGARYTFVKPVRKEELLFAVRNCVKSIEE